MSLKALDTPLSIAPMIDWTYTHFRVLMRILAPKALLYTEMQTVGAVLNNTQRALYFNDMEHPIALQLGGSQPQQLANCAKLAEQFNYDEINLNLGCPSDKVKAGNFGACLMNKPALVKDCLQAMVDAVSIPITAKIRIGIDEQDSYPFFRDFASTLLEAGVSKIIVHARKAWLNGLSPKQNRTIPPINYEFVYRLKEEMPHMPIIINGNITFADDVNTHLQRVDGVMLGRLACDSPYSIAEVHHLLYPESPLLSRIEIFSQYWNYLSRQMEKEVSISLLIKPLLNLMHGLPGNKFWKQILMEFIKTKNFDLIDTLQQHLLAKTSHLVV